MPTRLFGGVSKDMSEMENYLGQQFILYYAATAGEMATLGMPENPDEVFARVGYKLYKWDVPSAAWVDFLPGNTPGATGATGATGPAGTNGTNGANGAIGATGPKGDTGATGAKGDTGTQGPKGDTGATGSTGTTGTAGTNGTNGTNAAPGTPVAMTVTIGTAYQAPDATKPAHINLMLESNYTTTLAGTSADELEVRIGPTNAVTGASGGYQAATWKTSLTGIALTIGLGLIQRNATPIMLPAGWYFCVRRLSGTAAVISSATAQPLS